MSETPTTLDPSLVAGSNPATALETTSKNADERSLNVGYGEIMQGLLGISEAHSFTEEYPHQLADESVGLVDEWELRKRVDALATALPDVVVDPLTIPSSRSLDKLAQEDWDAVRVHEQPLMALWSKARLNEVRQNEASTGLKKWHASLRGDKREHFNETAQLVSLPLLHGTTVDGLRRILSDGKMVSNRVIDEQNRAANTGNTNYLDRSLGLDQYVFADFARPHMQRGDQSPVTVVISPRALFQAGSFVTEKDRADCLTTTEYFKGLSLPEDFYETALRRIRSSESIETRRERGTTFNLPLRVGTFAAGVDSDPVFNGPRPGLFSTWEAKMPEVATDFIEKIIFRSQEELDAFIAEFGTTIPAIYEPNLKDNLGVLQNPKARAETYRSLVERDYQERRKIVDGDPDHKTIFRILGQAIKDRDQDDELLLLEPPKWRGHQLSDQAAYKDLEAAHKAIEPRVFDYPWPEVSIKHTGPIAIAKVIASGEAEATTEIFWVDKLEQ